jgi:hypothetical protein
VLFFLPRLALLFPYQGIGGVPLTWHTLTVVAALAPVRTPLMSTVFSLLLFGMVGRAYRAFGRSLQDLAVVPAIVLGVALWRFSPRPLALIVAFSPFWASCADPPPGKWVSVAPFFTLSYLIAIGYFALASFISVWFAAALALYICAQVLALAAVERRAAAARLRLRITRRGYEVVETPPIDENCTICRDPLRDDLAGRTTCGHMFHFACLSQWLAHAGSCPMCRRNLSPLNFSRGTIRRFASAKNISLLAFMAKEWRKRKWRWMWL